jgi:hypothetical protein
LRQHSLSSGTIFVHKCINQSSVVSKRRYIFLTIILALLSGGFWFLCSRSALPWPMRLGVGTGFSLLTFALTLAVEGKTYSLLALLYPTLFFGDDSWLRFLAGCIPFFVASLVATERSAYRSTSATRIGVWIVYYFSMSLLNLVLFFLLVMIGIGGIQM